MRLFDGSLGHFLRGTFRWSSVLDTAKATIRVVGRERRVVVTDVLIYEAALALWFRLPDWVAVVPESVRIRWPWIELAWFATWMACPILTFLGLFLVPRALRVRGGWVQVVVALLLALSVWERASQIEFL